MKKPLLKRLLLVLFPGSCLLGLYRPGLTAEGCYCSLYLGPPTLGVKNFLTDMSIEAVPSWRFPFPGDLCQIDR